MRTYKWGPVRDGLFRNGCRSGSDTVPERFETARCYSCFETGHSEMGYFETAGTIPGVNSGKYHVGGIGRGLHFLVVGGTTGVRTHTTKLVTTIAEYVWHILKEGTIERTVDKVAKWKR